LESAASRVSISYFSRLGKEGFEELERGFYTGIVVKSGPSRNKGILIPELMSRIFIFQIMILN